MDEKLKGYFLSEEEKKVVDDFVNKAQESVFEKIFKLYRDVSEESEKLGVDIVDVVNENVQKPLLKLEDDER